MVFKTFSIYPHPSASYTNRTIMTMLNGVCAEYKVGGTTRQDKSAFIIHPHKHI